MSVSRLSLHARISISSSRAVAPVVPMAASRLDEWLNGLVQLMEDGLSRMPTDAQLRANYPALEAVCALTYMHT